MTTALSVLRQRVGSLLRDGSAIMLTGTPTGTFTTTGFAAAGLDQYENDYFVDWWLRIYAGTHKDITVTVTAFVKANGAFTFSPAVTGAIDATDLFELWRDFTPEEVNSAINLAITQVESEALADKVDESLVINDLLTDGLFEIWTSSSALTNWTTAGTGTLARENTIKMEGSYSAKLTNTVSNAFSIYQAKSNYALYAGKAASLYARVNCATADRVRIRLTDGVNTWNSDYHDGKGWRDAQSSPPLKIEGVTLSAALTELTTSVRVETGAAISCYVDKMYLVAGNTIYEYAVPSGFYTIERLTREDATIGKFSRSGLIDGRLWQILGSSTKKLWIDPKVSLNSGRKLRLEGQAIASQLTLDADTTTINPSFLVYQAAATLADKKENIAKFAQDMANRERSLLFTIPRGKVV